MNDTVANLVAHVALAQKRANATREQYGVWEHVGLYGHMHGDVPARHTFRAHAMSRPDPDITWALVAIVDPE